MNDKEALKVLKNLSIDYNGMDDDEIAEMDCAVDFAIAALEEKVASQLQDCKQVVDDLVSRQAAIDAHYEYCNKHPDAGFPVWSLKILKDLPSAQPEPQWIPCSERLPEERQMRIEEWLSF